MNLFTLPPERPFLDAIAAEWMRRAGYDPVRIAQGLILLPTRRAARALAEAFLRASDGAALLLPRITGLGALDETPLALAGALDLPPAIEPAERLAALSALILALRGRNGAPRTLDRAWMLAGELAALMDEAERAEIDLSSALPGVVDSAHAIHWQQTVEFLRIVTDAWPAVLAERGVMNPAARQVALLDAQSRAWAAEPPSEPIWIAGATGGIPAVARLIHSIGVSPVGCVVLPGLDTGMPDAVWNSLPDSHPQAGLARLLGRLGATRADVAPFPCAASAVPPGRAVMLGRSLLSPDTGWRGAITDIEGLYRLDASDQQEEATAIALILRDAIEAQGRRAALVTPDRGLAARVAAELRRWGVVADDSAGEPLKDTPPAVFLRLLARVVAERLAPVPLLALLKHPLAAAGLSPTECRAGARSLELACLRGPRPGPGLAGLRRAVDRARKHRVEAGEFLAHVESCLEPLFRIASAAVSPPDLLLSALIAAAESLAATDEHPGPDRLWSQEEGEALATVVGSVQAALAGLPDQKPTVLPGLLDAALEGAVVRSRRAVRDGGAAREHPRVFIWGLLEARLQAVDTVVLGGLAEEVWPQAADPGPWMSRPMRAAAGLPSPEERIGQSAHDFVMAACASPVAVLSCPRRRDHAPAVPSRWLVRLDTLLHGAGSALPRHPAAYWARMLDEPTEIRPAVPPAPRPPVVLRPRSLSVTEVETWIRDPYAIYAKHVLRLRPLDPLDQATDPSDYGVIVHDGLHRFLREHGASWPPDAERRLRAMLHHALHDAGLRQALIAWWTPRLSRVAGFVANLEADRRSRDPPGLIAAEVTGTWNLAGPAGPFRITGRADRIETHPDGRIAIIDYKTGMPPTQKQVDVGLAPQLPLEAAMAHAGAFPDVIGTITELAYWRLAGGWLAGKACPLWDGNPDQMNAAVVEARDGLRRRIAAFDEPMTAYRSRPRPDALPRFSDYAHLARVAEWAAAEDE